MGGIVKALTKPLKKTHETTAKVTRDIMGSVTGKYKTDSEKRKEAAEEAAIAKKAESDKRKAEAAKTAPLDKNVAAASLAKQRELAKRKKTGRTGTVLSEVTGLG